MELSEMTVASFANLLGSDAPAPGGGSAAALEGSLGAALTAMVSVLTLGRKKYMDYQELAQDVNVKASRLKEEFLVAMERDTEAFNAFGDAMSMPRETDEEKAARSAAMQKALVACIESPLYMMELSLETVELTRSIHGKSNANAMSDLGVSALSLIAAVRGAWLNVLINLGGLKDTAAAEAYRAKGKLLLDRTVAIGEEIYRSVEAAL